MRMVSGRWSGFTSDVKMHTKMFFPRDNDSYKWKTQTNAKFLFYDRPTATDETRHRLQRDVGFLVDHVDWQVHCMSPAWRNFFIWVVRCEQSTAPLCTIHFPGSVEWWGKWLFCSSSPPSWCCPRSSYRPRSLAARRKISAVFLQKQTELSMWWKTWVLKGKQAANFATQYQVFPADVKCPFSRIWARPWRRRRWRRCNGNCIARAAHPVSAFACDAWATRSALRGETCWAKTRVVQMCNFLVERMEGQVASVAIVPPKKSPQICCTVTRRQNSKFSVFSPTGVGHLL